MKIDPRQAVGPALNLPKVVEQDEGFGELLAKVLREVTDAQQNARGLQNEFLAGGQVELHDLMIAMERASVSMQLTMQVRNKLLEAWQEIQRIQV